MIPDNDTTANADGDGDANSIDWEENDAAENVEQSNIVYNDEVVNEENVDIVNNDEVVNEPSSSVNSDEEHEEGDEKSQPPQTSLQPTFEKEPLNQRSTCECKAHSSFCHHPPPSSHEYGEALPWQ